VLLNPKQTNSRIPIRHLRLVIRLLCLGIRHLSWEIIYLEIDNIYLTLQRNVGCSSWQLQVCIKNVCISARDCVGFYRAMLCVTARCPRLEIAIPSHFESSGISGLLCQIFGNSGIFSGISLYSINLFQNSIYRFIGLLRRNLLSSLLQQVP